MAFFFLIEIHSLTFIIYLLSGDDDYYFSTNFLKPNVQRIQCPI